MTIDIKKMKVEALAAIKRDYSNISMFSPSAVLKLIEKYKALESDLETERLRLAACGVAALGYFDGCKDEYRSASLEDTLRLYESNKELKAENEESKNALGDYFCSADDLAPAIRRLVSAYQERNQTAAKFMQELNETEAERDELKRQLAEYKADAELAGAG